MNILQQSIARTRRALHERNRLVRVMTRQIKAEKEHSNTNLELLLDDIVAHTGLELKPENMPTIMTYLMRFAEEQQRRREEPDGDVDGMKDFPL